MAMPVVTRAFLPRVLVLGDSSTANQLLDRPSHLYTSRLERALGIMIQNLARPGGLMTTLTDGVQTLPGYQDAGPTVDLLNPIFPVAGIVIMNLGSNDWGLNVPLVDFRAAYSALLASLPLGPFVVCVTPIWRDDEAMTNANGDTLEDFRIVISEVCAGHTVLDGRQAIPNYDCYFLDGKHPNRLGNRRLARFLADGLAPLLP